MYDNTDIGEEDLDENEARAAVRAYAFAQASIAKSEAGFHVILYFQTLTQTNHYGYAQYLHSFEAKKLPTTSKNAKATAQKAVSKASVTPNTENAKAAAAGAALQKATSEVNAMPWLHQTPYIVRHCSTIRPHISCVTAVPELSGGMLIQPLLFQS